MLSVSGLMMGSSGDGGVAAAEAHESGGGGSCRELVTAAVRGGGGVEEISERSGGGGNRWPKQETLALLKIRFDMDVAFKDSNFKGPLWEEVSRKMAELGFQRSGKKCREKFENVNKYHKRTKDGRASNPIGKTYRFFDQLQAWESTPVPVLSFSSTTYTSHPPPPATAMAAAPMQTNAASFPIPSISPDPLSVVHPKSPINIARILQATNTSKHPQIQPFKSLSLESNSTSSSTSSDECIKRRRGKKKRKRKEYFLESLIKNMLEKQEELHKKVLDTLDERERDQMTREAAWRNQETERMNREHQLLVQERSISAAKDAAVVAFLQKLTHQSNNMAPSPENTTQPPPQQSTDLRPPPTPAYKILNNITRNSRWPKVEVEALINLRTSLDLKYQENMPKGTIWEDISAAMGKLGYNRSSKRCKEKWENINKYFKKAKDIDKKRPQDSKTCPYFHRLDALHKKRAIMARPEQQWPVHELQKQDSTLHDQDQDEEIENIDHEEEDQDYEIVAKKQLSSMENAAE
ncbi:trihelix transcription factor DF1-like [Henckelia pumila]|uniref:trihelix transcription factor DF1-like n=1 Tax=Henckelia pumila TaxID=405737 RepID=UPI003C6E950F